MPVPQLYAELLESHRAPPNGPAVDFSVDSISAGVSDDCIEIINATIPATWGVAMLVPE